METGSSSRDGSEAVGDKQCGQKQEERARDLVPAPSSSVTDAVDRFIEETENVPEYEMPDMVESFPEMVDAIVAVFEFSRSGMSDEERCSLVESVNRISKLVNRLQESNSDSSIVSSCLDKASSVQLRAITFLDQQFRHLLENANYSSHGKAKSEQSNNETPKAHKRSSSISTKEPDGSTLPKVDEQLPLSENYPDYSPETISTMTKIAGAMILAGYEVECCISYKICRRQALKEEFEKLGFGFFNVEEVQKMSWEALDREITAWLLVVHSCTTAVFPGERGFCDTVFSTGTDHSSSVSKSLFACLASTFTIRFIDFCTAVLLTKRSAEKLFKILDMYEALRDLAPVVVVNEYDDQDLISEISVTREILRHTAVNIFLELETSVMNDPVRFPTPKGDVHPLTRYTMNYLRYACDYKDTLDEAFSSTDQNTEALFTVHLHWVMEELEENIREKSKLYKDLSLGCVFLMNNGRYIVKMIKESQVMSDVVGDPRRMEIIGEIRANHRSYRTDTVGRLLQCMSQEGMIENGKLVNPVMASRFKSFNTTLEEIYKTQNMWVVPDDQMRSELRASVSSVLIPAYRSFLGNFTHQMKIQAEKHTKYQPEDVEILVEELFDGIPTSN